MTGCLEGMAWRYGSVRYLGLSTVSVHTGVSMFLNSLVSVVGVSEPAGGIPRCELAAQRSLAA